MNSKIIKLLIKIKNKNYYLFIIFQFVNNFLVWMMYRNNIKIILNDNKIYKIDELYVIRPLSLDDLNLLCTFFERQDSDQLKFFHPHGFKRKELKLILKSISVMKFGLFENEKLIGYAILKLIYPKKAFIGRLISKEYQGKGFGKMLALYLYNVIKKLNFEGYTTISSDNLSSIKSHEKNKKLLFIEHIDDKYSLYKIDLK